MADATERGPGSGPAPMFIDSILREREAWNLDMVKPWNYALSAVDVPATSLVNLLPGISLDSFVPEFNESYHRSKYTYDAISTTASLFLGYGAAAKGMQATGWAGRTLRSAGASDELIRFALPNMAEVRKVDNLMAAARLQHSTDVAYNTFRTTPGLGMATEVGTMLTPYGRTMGEVEGWVKKARTTASVKEALWLEAIALAAFNNSEFLFPDDLGAMNYLLFAGLGVGAIVGIDHLLGRAVQRQGMRRAAEAGDSIVNEYAQWMGVTERNTLKGVVGEDWQWLLAGKFGRERADQLEANADQLAAASGGLLSRDQYIQSARELRQALDANQVTAVQRMAKNRPAEATMRGGLQGVPAVTKETALSGQQRAAVVERVNKNTHAGVGLASIEDVEVTARMHSAVTKADEMVETRLKALQAAIDQNAPADAIRAARKSLDEAEAAQKGLDQYRAGVLETTGAVNQNVWRRLPFWESAQAKGVKVASDGHALTMVGGPGRMAQVRLGNNGKLHLNMRSPTNPNANMKALSETELDFDEITALQTMVGKLTAQDTTQTNWKNGFWDAFVRDPKAEWRALPFPLLDAIADGRLAIPSSNTHPIIGKVQAAIDSGEVGLASLQKKALWMQAEQKRAGQSLLPVMDVFDYEKALNLRLTDARGLPNTLWNALDGLAASSVHPGSMLQNPNKTSAEMLDDLFEWGAGFGDVTDAIVRSHMRRGFDEGLVGIGTLDAHTKPGGIGTLHHKAIEPTDNELQLAALMHSRNAARANDLLNSTSSMVAGISRALVEDEVAYAGANKSGSVFRDHLSGANIVSQTTWAHRYQGAIQHAHTLSQRATHAIDEMINADLKPIAEMAHQIARSESGPATFAQYSQAHMNVSHGIALKAADWAPGVNVIDVSRPGAKNLLDNLGPLQGAPAKGQDWHLFDVTIAAREGRYVPIELSDEAAGFLNAVTGVQYKLLEAENAIRKAAGLPAIPQMLGHMPVADFSRYKLRYIQDPQTNKVVGFVKARTDAEADRLLGESLVAMNKNLPVEKHRVSMTAGQISEHYEAVDQMFLSRLSDFSGIRQTGGAQGRNVDFRMDVTGDLFEEHMISMRNNYTDVKDRAVVSVMSNAMSEANRVKRMTHGAPDPNAKQTSFSAIEQWENVLLGRHDLPKDGVVRKLHGAVEDIYNTVTGKLTDTLPWNLRALQEWSLDARAYAAGKVPAGSKLEKWLTPNQRTWMERAVADYQPFTHLAGRSDLKDYLKLDRSTDPYKLARNLQKANRMATTAFLKHANIMHPILNMLGIAVTLPGVLGHAMRQGSETAADYAKRMGHLADYIDPDKGIATLSPAKLLAEGQHLLFSDKAAMTYAASKGYLHSNILEELNKLNDLRPSNFDEALEGVAKWTDFINLGINKVQKRVTGQDPSAFTLSERSETFSRAIAHATGLAFIRQAGRAGMSESAQHSFAHWFANQNVADFAPNIRGEAFRGVAGIPFGLFQSYSINMYQRLFGYIENRSTRALAIQALTQFGVFGMSSMPGWNQVNSLWFEADADMKADSRGATSLNERVYGAFGKGFGDVLMHGPLSSFPRLFGADSGLNLYTSGDLNLRAPLVPPAMSLVVQTGQGIMEGVKRGGEFIEQSLGDARADPLRLAEVLAHYAPSRGVKSLADLVVGERIDRKGNLIVEDTRSGVALLSRLMGTRTTNELQLSSAVWANSQAQSQRVADMGRVRQRMLRSLREGELSTDEAAFWLNKYLMAGGRQDQWVRWLKNAQEMATSPRDQRLLKDIIHKSGEIFPHNVARYRRMENAGADIERWAADMGFTGAEAEQ